MKNKSCNILHFPFLNSFLLDHSRDGVALSTDDYFRQQGGYTYNAAQLGDAHDWNQKRGLNEMKFY